MTMSTEHRLILKNFGPIKSANITFGDFTVIIGPQATGKSIFLQTLKLILDRDHIHNIFNRYSMTFDNNSAAFLGGYFGKGMAAAWTNESSLAWEGKKIVLPTLAKHSKSKNWQEKEASLFLIPAQRVMSLANGTTQNFGQFSYGDPYALRYFSDTIHNLLQNEYGVKTELFPQANRLNTVLREQIEKHLYGGSQVSVDTSDFTKRLVLNIPGHKEGLPYTAWSAGQREFTPLLLGLYWLCPAGKISKRPFIDWVVIEEPEMGLHPQGIEAVLLLLLELTQRGYRVIVSTHSPTILELVWALQEFKKHHATEADVRNLLSIKNNNYAKILAQSILEKNYKVYYFDRQREVQDISSLDPAAIGDDEAEWGGLLGFSSRVGNAIADVVNRSLLQSESHSNLNETE